MTHDELVRKAACWLRRKGYGVVFTEFRTCGSEEPDALGFNSRGSCLVECKTSRSDFLVDFKKFHRRHPEEGMGNVRFFMTASGLLSPEELPAGWGLLEVRGARVYKVKDGAFFLDAYKNDQRVLYSALRRLEVCGILRPGVELCTLQRTVEVDRERLRWEQCELNQKLARVRFRKGEAAMIREEAQRHGV